MSWAMPRDADASNESMCLNDDSFFVSFFSLPYFAIRWAGLYLASGSVRYGLSSMRGVGVPRGDVKHHGTKNGQGENPEASRRRFVVVRAKRPQKSWPKHKRTNENGE